MNTNHLPFKNSFLTLSFLLLFCLFSSSCDHKFPVHFVVLTDSLQGTDAEITDELKAVVDTLNRYFTVEDSSNPPDNRRSIVSFNYKSAILLDEAQSIGGDLVSFADTTFNFDNRHSFRALVNDPANADIVADDAINIFVVDCWALDTNNIYVDVNSSHAKNNDHRPYAVLDYARITGKASRQAVEEHEMGHCFKLAHLCDPSASRSSSTNIMASAGSYPLSNAIRYNSADSTGNCSGSGGMRDMGFSSDQELIIIAVADTICDTLNP